MLKYLPWVVLAAAVPFGLSTLTAGADTRPASLQQWPQWRGPLGSGEAPSAQPPVEWGPNRHIAWKAAIPGGDKSTPIIWGDLIVVTTAMPDGGNQQFAVIGLNRADGAERWRRIVRTEQPHEGTHQDGTYAGGSAITDGTRIYAFFGSRGLYALDLTGAVLWEKQFGRMQTRLGFGEGSSPALHGDTLVVNWDHEGDDFIVALDVKTGTERWRRTRDEPTTWTTPHIIADGVRPQVVVGGTNRTVGYDLESGNEIWTAPGLTANVIPTPVSGDGMLFATSGFRGNALLAIRVKDAKGEISGPPAIAWSYDRDTPYVPSPLLYKGGLYFLKSNSGILTRLDAATGKPHYTERLEDVPNVYASPVAADDRVYVTARDGTTVVLAAGPALKVLATNRLDEPIDASPALVDREIYLRGARHLYRISE